MSYKYQNYLLLFIIFLSLGLSSQAQGLLNKTITIEARNKKLGEVLQLISKEGGFSFSYNSNIIKKDSIVTVNAKSKTVKLVLDDLLGASCRYKEVDKYVIIQPEEKEKWYVVSGIVTDGVTGEVLPDATVFERNQLASALTDKNGYFKLHLRDRDRYRTADITISKGFYVDTSISLVKGYDQELTVQISPQLFNLPDIVVTQNSGVDKTWLGKLMVSTKLKTTTANLGKFLVEKPYQMSLVPGLGTHGKMSGSVTNKVSLNILGGYSAGSDGVEVGGMFNIDRKDVRYAQAAGIVNFVEGNVTGGQAAGFTNIISGKATGAQAAGFFNKAANVRGVQAAGFCNIATDTVRGVQTSGFISIAKSASVQVSGFINVADHVTGLQTAGFVNLADSVHGLQLAGFVNIANKVKGVQLAGFVNIADSSDCPIGFLNIIGNGEMAVGLTYDEVGTYMMGLRSGGRILYGIIGAGINRQPDKNVYAMELGFGAHIKVTRHFRVNTELSSLSFNNFSHEYFLDNAIRVLPSVRFGPVEVFGGAGFNVAIYSERPTFAVETNSSIWTGNNATGIVEMRIGYRAGVQLHL